MRKMLSDSILDLGKCPNQKHMKVKVHVFRLGHFLMSKIKSESIFLIKYYIITILNFFWSILAYIALQQTRQDSLPQVKLGKTLNLRLFWFVFLTKIKVDPESW